MILTHEKLVTYPEFLLSVSLVRKKYPFIVGVKLAVDNVELNRVTDIPLTVLIDANKFCEITDSNLSKLADLYYSNPSISRVPVPELRFFFENSTEDVLDGFYYDIVHILNKLRSSGGLNPSQIISKPTQTFDVFSWELKI